jgi:DNA mismatch repair protein MutS2
MNQRAIKVLEFNKIIEMLKSKASSSLGKAEIENIKINKDIDLVNKRLNETNEVVDIINKYGLIPFGAVHDLTKEMSIANIGSYLAIKQILRVAVTMKTARRIKSYILKIEKSEMRYPIINSLINLIQSFKYLEDKISSSIIGEDEIADHASIELFKIRTNIRKTNEQIRSKLDNIITNPKTQKYLQEALVTVRNDRFVVPVKSSYKNMIKGIVHDRSASGITLYIEPNAVVALNNKLKVYKMDEEIEIERILYELTAMINEVSNEILSNQIVLKKVDVIIAKASLSIEMNAIVPRINNEKYIRIVKGRHPLISEKDVVPLDVWVGKEFTSLVITGPNTGGKTVTLKTIGLLTVMTMAGLHIPANSGTEISIFDEVFADIGDEQSIEQSLSTFSSHMTNIVEILKNVTSNSLVLFDELGAGTDPTEGAALATSILRKLFEKNIITVATTHYNELKEYALIENGIENACVEFDVATLSPTYKVLVGVPGKSNAFDISRKLGLMEDVIDEAQKHIKRENVQFEEIISHIESDRKVSEKERDEAINLRIEIEKMKRKLDAEKEEMDNTKKKIIRDAKEKARKILKDAKEESKDIINELRKLEKSVKIDNKRIEELKSDINNKINEQSEIVFDNNEKHIVPNDLKIGDLVKIVSLNKDGNVLEINGKSVTVQAGNMKINIDKSNLKRIKNRKKEKVKIEYKKESSKVVKNIKSQMDIRGMNVDEATLILDNYLDEVYLSSLNEIRIIHGKGTGALRKGVREFLETHYHVKKIREGEYNEGGSGVTFVTLK